jgi:hypothetical protein
MTQLEAVLDRLHGVHLGTNGSYAALCPAHDDHDPSLSVSQGSDGRVLLCCHAGCETKDVVAAIGLSLKDLFPRRNGQTWIIRNRAGEAVAEHHRYETARGTTTPQAART